MEFEVKNRWTGNVQFTEEIECEESALRSVKLGLAVRWGVKNGADLTDADLTDAYLTDAYLAGADLAGAYLAGANLAGAYLAGANLTGANLTGAKIAGADLAGVYLAGANLTGANLAGVYLAGANGAALAVAKTRILPEGDLIGWKKCRDNVIVKVAIPAAAKRSHAFGRKCRAEYADVLEVIGAGQATSKHDNETIYTEGSRVPCDEWCEDWQQECAGGIHFFITREEAEAD